MAGILLFQPNGAGILNSDGDAHPLPVTVENNLICQLSLTGASTNTYRWTLSKPAGSASVLSSATSAGPSFVPDVEDGAYSITLTDINENVYILDIAVATVVSPGDGGGSSIAVTLETYSDLRVASYGASTPPASVVLKGRTSAGDGGGGTFIYLPSSAETDNDGTFILDGDGNVFARVYSGSLDVRWFGAKAIASGTTDSSAAINAAILVATDPPYGNSVYIPKAAPGYFYYCADSIEVHRSTRLHGDHGNGDYANTNIHFPYGVAAIVIPRNEGVGGVDGSGHWSQIENISFHGVRDVDGLNDVAAYGVEAHVTALIRNCTFRYFHHGIRFAGDHVENDGTNTNHWEVSNVRIINCSGKGLWVEGLDGNAGFATHVDISYTGEECFYDDSDFGNTYIGCHAAAAYHLNSVPRPGYEDMADRIVYASLGTGVTSNVYFNCYAEDGEFVRLRKPAMWVGSHNFGHGFTDDSDGTIVGTDITENLSGHVYIGARNAPTHQYSYILFPAGAGGFFEGTKFGHSFSFSLRHVPGSHIYASVYANADGQTGFGATDEEHSRGGGYAIAERGLLFNSLDTATTPRRLFQSDETPGGAGTYPADILHDWLAGDRFAYRNPSAGGYAGAVCTRSGKSPKKWAVGMALSAGDKVQPSDSFGNNGHYYTVTASDGFAGPSEPSWTTGTNDIVGPVDGVTYQESGSSALWVDYGPIAYGDYVTRSLRGAPFIYESDADVDEYLRVTINTTSGTTAKWPIEVPDGCTLTGVVLTVQGGGNASLPAVVPGFRVRELRLSTNATTTQGAWTDGSINVTQYNDVHTIEADLTPIVVDNIDHRYSIEFYSESGANAVTGFVVIGITLTFLPALIDRGAA